MCWVFNWASAGATLKREVRTTTITILEKTRFFTETGPFSVVRRDTAHARCDSDQATSAGAGAGPVPTCRLAKNRRTLESVRKLGGATTLSARLVEQPRPPECRSYSVVELNGVGLGNSIEHRPSMIRGHVSARTPAQTWRTTCTC